MQTMLKKWGNSLAIRIPNHLVERLQISQDSILEIDEIDGKLIIQKPKDLQILCNQITPNNLNIDTQENPQGKEW